VNKEEINKEKPCVFAIVGEDEGKSNAKQNHNYRKQLLQQFCSKSQSSSERLQAGNVN